MPALMLDGVHIAEVDPQDAAILRDLVARAGAGRLVMPPAITGGRPEPLRMVEVEGEPRVITRADWMARLAIHFAEDRVEGDQAGRLVAANDQVAQLAVRAA